MSAQPIEKLENVQDVSQTHRVSVPELEKVLYHPHKVLDCGFVRVVDYMGSDASVVQAARVSYGRGTKKTSEDRGLIFYLMRHRHTTPFEMCELKLHVKLPIFVARQWIRHRTANVNEYSARYSILSREFYVPEPEQVSAQSKVNNQGRGNPLQAEQVQQVLALLRRDSLQCYDTYAHLLNMREGEDGEGVARELARINLTLNYYTEWYWKIDLHNLLHFVNLRADPHAQWEIQEYARVLLDIVKVWTPMVFEAFCEYRMYSGTFSREALKALKKMVRGVEVSRADTALTKREWDEMMRLLELDV